MSVDQPAVSVVVPCFNEEGSLRELHQRLREEFVRLAISAEIIYVDDGSTDDTREILRALAAADAACRVIAFRCNCGKAMALSAGLQLARGAQLLTLDADLQDDPAEIPRFLAALEDADMVVGWKALRKDPTVKIVLSHWFNATVRSVTGVQLHDMNCGFKGFRRQVIEEVPVYGDLHRYLPVLAVARGFTVSEIVVTHHPRRFGVSKYGWERFLRGSFDLVTVVYLTKYRLRPLHFFGTLGLGCLLAAIIFGIALGMALSVVKPSLWHSLLWMLTGALFTLGPLFVGLGLLAEGHLAATLQTMPAPPTAECINCDEGAHVR